MNRNGVPRKQNGVHVALTRFAFKNHKLIEMMRKRGTMINSQDFKNNKLDKYERKVLDLIEKDDEGKLEIPTAVFITFEHPNGVVAALESNDHDSLKEIEILPGQCFGQKKFKVAPEPSDIIWEHRQFTVWVRRAR